jgi:hydrogenase expression/formation protein HypE
MNDMSPPRRATRRLDLADGRVDLTHGAGGRAMQQLIEEIFRPAFDNPMLARVTTKPRSTSALAAW